MRMFAYFIFGISYALACVVQPGPFQAFLLSQSLSNGWRKTFPLVFAPLISDLPLIILVIIILSNVPHFVLPMLQTFGGVFLLYLGYNSYQTWHKSDKNDKNDISGNKNLLKAIMVNLLNPNPYMGWTLVMGPLLIKGWNEKPSNAIVLLTGFYSSMIIYSAIMIMLFAAAGNLGSRVKRILSGISVIALVLFGFYELLSGILTLS
jgi:threonine/homoserine/homoserine lactone efflux protein